MLKQPSVLFVCLGNICRSPACEGICRSMYGGSLHVDSCGTSGWHVGQTPDERSVKVCKKNGVDISSHRARKFTKKDWNDFDVIAALDDSVYRDLERIKPSNCRGKLYLFNEPNGIDDPYYGGQDGFDVMFREIKSAMPKFIETTTQ